jgi:hypothetical protein
MNLRHLLALPALLALAACGGSTEAVRPLPAPPPPKLVRPTPPAAIQTQRPRPHIQILPGLEGVIGADADALTRQFGAPRLDVRDGDARKLQWSGSPCVLDAYLYPPDGGGRPTATYVDARRGDGRDVDRAACVAALRQSPQRR